MSPVRFKARPRWWRLTAVTAAILAVLAAATWPAWAMDDGLGCRGGEAAVFGRHALREARGLLSHPAERLLVLRLRVAEVEPLEAWESPGPYGDDPFVVDRPYRARVTARSWFGLIYAAVEVTPAGAAVRRVPWLSPAGP